jgi:predicted  nucleic acid-binding Zn-ribbon protein
MSEHEQEQQLVPQNELQQEDSRHHHEEEDEQDADEQIAYADLVKTELLSQYRDNCQQADLEAHEAFCAYLEETYDENESIELIIQGNDKYNFTNRVDDKQLIVLCQTLEKYAIYITEIDLRYNKITDHGAKALANLINRAPQLLGLNL